MLRKSIWYSLRNSHCLSAVNLRIFSLHYSLKVGCLRKQIDFQHLALSLFKIHILQIWGTQKEEKMQSIWWLSVCWVFSIFNSRIIRVRISHWFLAYLFTALIFFGSSQKTKKLNNKMFNSKETLCSSRFLITS